MRKTMLSLFLALLMVVSVLPVTAQAAGKATIRQVETDGDMSMAVTSRDDLYVWGTDNLKLNGGNNLHEPTWVMGDVRSVCGSHNRNFQSIINIDGGPTEKIGRTILIIRNNGDLYAWGSNNCFQLGSGEQVMDYNRTDWGPVYVMSGVKKAATSSHFCAAITEDGRLFGWGYLTAQPGVSENNYHSPTVIGSDVKDVCLDDTSITILKEDGSVWTLGRNFHGDDFGPGGKQMLTGCKAVAAAKGYTVALKENGELYGWGHNSYAVLCRHWNEEHIYTPTKMADHVREMSVGFSNIYFIKNDNTLWSTGMNRDHERGLDVYYSYYDPVTGENTEYPPLPTKMADNVVTVSSGCGYVLFVKNDGLMYGCGQDFYYNMGCGESNFHHNYFDPRINTAKVIYPEPVALSAGKFAGMFGPAFRDVPQSKYFAQPVDWAVERDITKGLTETAFGPYQTCSRAQIITFLWRAAGKESPAVPACIPDVPAGKYYSEAVQWAAENGIIPDGEAFRPNDPCTRLSAVEFMWKYTGSPAADPAVFSDVSSDAVNWAVEAGVTKGTTATTFSPEKSCTRGQIVTFLYNAFA